MFVKRTGLEHPKSQWFKKPEAKSKATEVSKRTLEDAEIIVAPDHAADLKEKKVAPYFIFMGKAPDDFSGFAELRYSDNNIYIGQFERGIPLGLGKYILPNKTTIEANWSDEMSHEKITFTYPDKTQAVYEGGWEQYRPNGKGKISYSNGDYYEGQWEMGKLVEGEGKQRDANGLYNGQFKNGKRDGRGEYILNNGKEHYIGEYKDGFVHGRGEIHYSSGTMYMGSFAKSLKHGEGTFYNKKTEEIFCGSWENNFLEGPVAYTDPQGTIFDCIYKQGICQSMTPRNLYPR